MLNAEYGHAGFGRGGGGGGGGGGHGGGGGGRGGGGRSGGVHVGPGGGRFQPGGGRFQRDWRRGGGGGGWGPDYDYGDDVCVPDPMTGDCLSPAVDMAPIDVEMTLPSDMGPEAAMAANVVYPSDNIPMLGLGASDAKPLYKKWQFWVALVGGVAVVGTGGYLFMQHRRRMHTY